MINIDFHMGLNHIDVIIVVIIVCVSNNLNRLKQIEKTQTHSYDNCINLVIFRCCGENPTSYMKYSGLSLASLTCEKLQIHFTFFRKTATDT